MKQKVLMLSSAVLLAGGALFGFTSPAKTADCPLVKNCPDKGTAACTLAGVPACCVKK
jgi:hypothetical protein